MTLWPRALSAGGRSAAAAFFTLFGLLTAHTLLETARDALFLARLPASQLPWAYLAIAAGAAAVAQLPGPSGRSFLGRHRLTALIAAMAAVNGGFWALGVEHPWMLRALYVWTGVSATVSGLHFWLVVGDLWTVTEAKRFFRWIAAGALCGGVAGAALAGVVATAAPPDRLLLASAAVQALTAFGPALILRSPGPPRARARLPLASSLRLVREHPYARAIAIGTLLSTLAVTAVDFVFKSAVAREIPPGQLGWFFASFYTLLNTLALATQLVATGWLLRLLGLPRALGVLPALLLLLTAGVAVGGGVLAAALAKLVEGSLREAHRTTSELLLVPMPDDLRARTKPFLDVVARRGGQALASLAILAAMALPGAEQWVAAGAALLCLAWLARAAALRRPYLDLFRSALREGKLLGRAELPPVDLGSLEALIAALGSGDDAEVIAAMDLLAEEGRGRLIPPLVLYHPSEQVVLHALALLERSGRRDFVAAADRLLSHPNPRLRAAALRARTAAAPDAGVLRAAAADASPVVRATASVGLLSMGEQSGEASGIVADLLCCGEPEAQRALAQAVAHRPSPAFADALLQLARASDPEVLVEVATAMGALRDQRFLPVLLRLLARHEVRTAAREALVAFGEPGFAVLREALADLGLPHEVRRHVPRTLSRFPPERAAPVLLARLVEEPDGMVRFKILRGLGRMVADHPGLPLDRDLLRLATERTLEAAFRLRQWRTVLEEGAREDPRRATPVHGLLVALVQDKQRHAVERLFRLLALELRGEDLEGIHRGLGNADPKLRASSRELLEQLLRPPLRRAVLALVDEDPDAERLARAGAHGPATLDYPGLVATLLDAPGDALRSLAMSHAAELGMVALRDRIAALRRDRPSRLLERAATRALAALGGEGPEVARAR